MSIHEVTELFIEWTKKKIQHHLTSDESEVYFREREIWWAALGQNIGHETNGKSKDFTRPVLILRKYSKTMCFILPFTTQVKPGQLQYQYNLEVSGKKAAANLSQGKTIGSTRLIRREEILSNDIFEDVCKKFVEFLFKKI